MFAILQISDTNTILRRPEIFSNRFDLPSGDAFFTVTTEKHLGKVPWKKLESCLGILRQDLITNRNITIPQGINITVFTPDILPRLILMNSATEYITKHKDHFRSKTLTIFDEKGICESYTEKLIHYFKSIKIITDNPDKYEHVSQNLMKTYGFSLIVSQECSFDSDVIITHRCNVPVYFDGTVFTNERRFIMNATVFSGSEIRLPEEYEQMRPSYIGGVLFASVLYEKCNEIKLGKLLYEDFGC